jgi:hypothetical protein
MLVHENNFLASKKALEDFKKEHPEIIIPKENSNLHE